MTVRELNGWTPKTYTVGPDGVTVTVTESRFTRQEKVLLLASRRADAAPRGRHGLLLSETTDPENQFKFRVPFPTTDWAQAEVDKAEAAYRAKYPKAPMGALIWRAEKKA